MQRALLTVILAAATAMPVFAATRTHEGLTYSTSAVKPGVWSTKFSKCRDYAEKNGLPLIVFWANNGCHVCADVCQSVGRSSKFQSWMSTSGAMFVFGLGVTGGENAEIKKFAFDSSKRYPFLAVQLRQKGASNSMKKTFTGAGKDAKHVLGTIRGILKPYARVMLRAKTGGSVTQVGYRRIGKHVKLVAKPKRGYAFKGWYNSSGKRLSTSATYRLKVTKRATYTARFKKK